MAATLAPVAAGLGLGIALASAPGPVQAVLLSESIRGGLGRGFRAMAGASLTFGVILLALALGLSLAAPTGPVLRILQTAGGALLLWLAIDGFRTAGRVDPAGERRALPPTVRGALAVILNPGAWLFLATAASSLLADAVRQGGRASAVLAAAALIAGLAVGDAGVVLLGGVGLRRAGERVGIW
ncbi:MAG: LysE family transporter, partial [Actinomycetota bacterium]|nr:LysE family transporter [Actinomycetota bacterium]